MLQDLNEVAEGNQHLLNQIKSNYRIEKSAVEACKNAHAIVVLAREVQIATSPPLISCFFVSDLLGLGAMMSAQTNSSHG